MPQYCLIKHRIENVTIDGDDPDRNPDRNPVTGMVTFTPLLGKGDAVVITENGQKTTLTLSPIEARITNGELWHRGEPGVKLFAGGPDTNPERIRYRAQFSNLIGGGRKVELKDILFEAVPGGELSLAVAQPVPGAPYPGYGATIEAGIAEISDVAVSYLELIEGARNEALWQVEGAVEAILATPISPEYTTFFDVSSNLINLDGLSQNMVIPAGQGDPVESALNNVTAPIRVTGGEKYTLVSYLRITYYDASGEYVGDFSATANPSDVRTAPEAAAYARLSIQHSRLDSAQMNKGEELLPYEQWRTPHIPASYLDLPDIPDMPDMPNITKSSNLINLDGLARNMVIPAGQGAPVESALNNVTAPIRVTSGETYIMKDYLRITFYDASGEYVGNSSGTANQPDTVTAPATAVSARITIQHSRLDTSQMNEGTELLPYEPFWVEVEGRRIQPQAINDDDGEEPGTDIGDLDFLVTDTAGLREEYTAPVNEDQPGLTATVTTDVYGWYDGLMALHPEYVTRQQIGVASEGTPMYAYTLAVPPTPTQYDGEIRPAILVISGVHGYEKAAVYSVWRMAKALCEEWEDSAVLDSLRWNFEIVIIPVGNPHSYDTSVRPNANGVDIARNFSAAWRSSEPGTVTYSGTGPLTEPETVAIDSIMAELAPRCVAGFSIHNYSASESNPSSFIWVPTATPITLRLGKALVSRMSRKWKREQSWITDTSTHYGYASKSGALGNEARQLRSYGILGGTFETSRLQLLDGEGVSHSSKALTLGLEATVNYVAMTAAEGVDYFNRSGKPWA